MIPAHRSPWYFFRDEFDLLEEEVDGIFLRHERVKTDARTHRMEDDVIEEQLNAEEPWEMADERAFGQEQEEDHETTCPHELSWYDEPRSVKDMLREHVRQDDLYEHALAFAERAYGWSGAWYYDKRRKDRDVFRVHVNVCLVPTKIALARFDESDDHPEALDLAAEEFDLALLYLRRVLESLQALTERQIDGVEPVELLASGLGLLRGLEDAQRRLLARRGFHSREL